MLYNIYKTNKIMKHLILIIVTVFVLSVMGIMSDYEVDVRCGKKGINVRLAFKKSFHGIIFSKGFYSDQKCRYVEGGQGIKMAAFSIPFSSCGTEIKFDSLKNMTNIIAIQHNPVLETWRDSELTLSCQSVSFSLNNKKEMSEPDIQIDSSLVVAWMEIKLEEKDLTPNFPAHLGDKLTVNIYIKDDGTFNDIAVGNCKAQNNLNISSETKFVNLLDDFGCSTNEKFLSSFNISTSEDGNFVASSLFSAFRFTDQDDLYLTCSVELCEEICYKFCPRKQNSENAERIVKKRSLSLPVPQTSNAISPDEENNRDLTRKLMYLTMNSIASRLREDRAKTSKNPGVIARNLAFEDHFDDHDDHADIEEFSTKENLHELVSELPEEETTNMKLNIMKKLKVLPPKPKSLQANETADPPDECFPKIRFIVSIVLFSLITLCLLITTILMACYIRSERKRSKINNFLLYSFR